MAKLNFVVGVGIFIPVYHRGDLVRASLDSLHTTLIVSSTYSLNVVVSVGINGADESLRGYLVDLNNIYGAKEITYVLYDPKKNIGKPACVNRMVDLLRRKVKLDYIVSYDSDMVVTEHDWLLKLVEIFEEYVPEAGQPKIGALCPNQSDNCCHVLGEDSPFVRYKDYRLVCLPRNEGVAGGVVVTTPMVWDLVHGYQSFRLHGADDAFFVLDCFKKGLVCPVVLDVSVRHPPEDDLRYVDWKVRACRDKLEPHEMRGYWG
jgi:hypothetical protein